MPRFNLDVESLTERQAKDALTRVVEKLDALDEEDFFGTEGWKHYFGLEG